MSDLHDDWTMQGEIVSEAWRRVQEQLRQRVAAYRHTHGVSEDVECADCKRLDELAVIGARKLHDERHETPFEWCEHRDCKLVQFDKDRLTR